MLKKITLFLITIILIFSLTSCSLLLDIFLNGWDSYDKVSYNERVYGTSAKPLQTGNYYFVQVNKSQSTIYEWNTAYQKTANSHGNRNVVSEESSDVNSESVFLPFALDQKFREENYKLLDSSERASDSTKYKYYTRTLDKSTSKDFYLNVKDSYLGIRNCTEGYTGAKCKIWYDKSIEGISTTGFKNVSRTTIKEKCESLAKKFDLLCSLEEDILGSHIYSESPYSNIISPQDKIEIVVFDIEGDCGTTGVAKTIGYFNPSDFLNYKTYNYSNECQVIYIDIEYLLEETNIAYSTLAHEFNHLLNYCKKTVENGKKCETWYTEMLAMLAEDMFQETLEIGDNDSPKARLLVLEEEKNNQTGTNIETSFLYNYNAGFVNNWQSSDGYAALRAYANAYAFGAYLVRNYGGFELLRQIATNAYVNEDSISVALKGMNIDGINDFEDALRREYEIIISNSTNSNSISLNKTIIPDETKYKENKIKFSAIDIYKKIIYNKESKTLRYLTIKQDLMKNINRKRDSNNRVNIGSYGFDYSYIGNVSRGSSLSLMVPDYSESVYECNLYIE